MEMAAKMKLTGKDTFHILYILKSNPHLNLIHTSFCRFLKRKKS